MDVAIGVTAIALTVVVFDRVAHRFDLSGPLVLMLVGILASFPSFVPEVHLDSEVVLLGLLPPLLYATAIRTSVVDFRANLRSITYLSVLLVVVTAAVVGLVAWLILPIPFAAAFALGAVVAPPDAVAATAVARKVGLPRQMIAILEGESLVNDASAITTLRAAIAATAGTATAWSVGGQFLWALLGGIVIGGVISVIAILVRKRITENVAGTAISFIIPWAAYLPAEELHSSGVIAVVTAGLLVGHKAQIVQTAQSRLSERTNWATVQFLLENAVFLLIGLQAKWIIADVTASGTPAWTVIGFCAAVLATVIGVRIVWVVGGRFLLFRRAGHGERPPLAQSLIIAWAGMRGVVTLAAAFLLPEDTPFRNVLLLAALVVTAGTLLLQGTTLPILVRRLGVRGPEARQDALAAATVLETAGSAAVAALDEVDHLSAETRDQVQQRIRRRTDQLWEQLGRDAAGETPSDQYRRVRLFTLGIERDTVLKMRPDRQIDQDVLSAVLNALDVEESMLAAVQARADVLDGEDVLAEPVAPPECAHLQQDSARDEPQPNAQECEDCVREGTLPVHLRLCRYCGNVACCDSSVGKHAARHWETEGHPVMRSFETGERWRWCYVDEQIG